MLSWSVIAPHLNLDPVADTKHAGELALFADAAERLIATHPDLRPEFLPLDLTDPLLRLAVLELIRDMWRGTQSGGGGQAFGQDFADPQLFTNGRPTLPPYVRGLLIRYMAEAQSPVGSFPAAAPWPVS